MLDSPQAAKAMANVTSGTARQSIFKALDERNCGGGLKGLPKRKQVKGLN
jgi:hypothetical protein